MAKTRFGIIEDIEESQRYFYDPERYHCIAIADDIYIDDWWDRLVLMKTYFHNLNRPELGLARYGITLIPPESLPDFFEIVLSDKRKNEDENLIRLAEKIQDAINRDKYMIHFGV